MRHVSHIWKLKIDKTAFKNSRSKCHCLLWDQCCGVCVHFLFTAFKSWCAAFVSDRQGCSIVKEAAILLSFYAITARPSAQLEAAATYQI